MKTLFITNDFPPRLGGIQQFIFDMAVRQPPGSVVVYTSRFKGWEEYDARQPFDVIREDTSVLLPTPAVARRAEMLVLQYECDSVVFGAMAPLGILGRRLRERTGVRRVVAITHGHEAGWAQLPGARSALRRIASGIDVVTYLGDYFRRRLDAVFGDLAELRQLTPGIDTERFSPSVSGALIRERYGIGQRPLITCISRLVPRKGQDQLVRALPEIKRRVPDAMLLLGGGGPYRRKLERLARATGVADDIIFTGWFSPIELPNMHAAADVFAMPCRTRRRGLDVEGLGVVYLEAAATGVPVVAGDSGGAPDAVIDGETGYVVDGRDLPELVNRLSMLLQDKDLASKLGSAGRAWIEAEWQVQTQADRLRGLLAEPHR